MSLHELATGASNIRMMEYSKFEKPHSGSIEQKIARTDMIEGMIHHLTIAIESWLRLKPDQSVSFESRLMNRSLLSSA